VTATNSSATNGFRLTVLNPGGRDPAQDFSQGINPPNDGEHAPVNFHAYAACTRGAFHRETKRAIAEGLPVLLLIRGDFRETRRALIELKKHGLTTAVSFKETGLHQIEQQLADSKRAALFREIVQLADGCLAATPEAVAFYGAAEFIPTPYPIDDARWDFSRPLEKRAGIFVGTREWDVSSRHHLAAVLLALELGEPVTLFDSNPRRSRKLLRALGLTKSPVRFITRSLPYREYLGEIARHKIVLQADKSAVPGQVAGDSLLCRLPCVGGDGAVDRLAFPEISGHGRSLGEIKEIATRLLHDPAYYRAAVVGSRELARRRLGFEAIANELAQFFSKTAH
jgi:hypothetical protein